MVLNILRPNNFLSIHHLLPTSFCSERKYRILIPTRSQMENSEFHFCSLYIKTQQKVVSLFRDFLEGFPPLLTGLSSKCHNFFSIWSLLSLEKYVRQKYLLCLFSKKKRVCLFPTIFTLLFQKVESFLPKIAYIGEKQTNYKKTFFK